MGRRDRRHGWGAFWRWVPVVLVLVLLAGAGAAYRFDLGARWFGTGEPDPATQPAAVAPPPGLTLPPLAAPAAGRRARATGPGAAAAKVRAALAPLLNDKDLGRRVFAVVADVDGGKPVFTEGSGTAMPASTTKLLTATAALEVLGPDHEFETRVVQGGGRRIVLVGGGDPLLTRTPVDDGAWPYRADIVDLARQTAAALREQGRKRVALSYDDSLFSGPAVNPHWPDDYVPDGVVSPITVALAGRGPRRLRLRPGRRPVGDRGRTSSRPSSRRFGVQGHRARRSRPTPPPGAAELASVSSAPLSQIVEWVLTVSDNEGAEVLARQVGLAVSDEGSFEAGVAGVLRTLRRLGVDTVDRPRLRRQRAVPREPARPAHPASTCCGWPRRRPIPSSGRRSPGCRSPGSPARSRTGSPTSLPRAAGWCAPRPAPSPGSARWPGRSPTRTARPWCSR